MTTTDKPTRRETRTSVRSRGKIRPLIITLHPTWMEIREKGCRYAYTVTYEQVRGIGARNAAEQLRQAKAEARKGSVKQ